jgi:hypothetical protein
MKTLDDLIDELYSLNDRNSIYAAEEEISLPTDNVIELTRQLIEMITPKLFIPEIISISIEEGICLEFVHNIKRMFVELLNDGEIGYIIVNWNTTDILENKKVNNISELFNVIKEFYIKLDE